MVCKICNKQFKNSAQLGIHIRKHGLEAKEYFDLFNMSGKCVICGKETTFISITKGYRKTCSPKCASILSKTKREQTNLKRYGFRNPAQSNKVKSKISETVKSEKCQNQIKATCQRLYGVDFATQNTDVKQRIINNTNYSVLSKKTHESKNAISRQFEIDNNCVQISKVIKQFGQGWLSFKDELELFHYKGCTFVKNGDLKRIAKYKPKISKAEKQIVNLCKELYKGPILQHDRKTISMELDVYLPDLKLAIEYNGNYWHSEEIGTPKDYHLIKSLKCQEKGIRLIHIYEFEEFDKQLKLLKDLLLGKDNYLKDFNKNNIGPAPKPFPNITNRGYTVWSCGPLIKEENI